MLMTEPPGGRLVSGAQLAEARAFPSCACATELNVISPLAKTKNMTRALMVLLVEFVFEAPNESRFKLIAHLSN
jgi:hypothetical protein